MIGFNIQKIISKNQSKSISIIHCFLSFIFHRHSTNLIMDLPLRIYRNFLDLPNYLGNTHLKNLDFFLNPINPNLMNCLIRPIFHSNENGFQLYFQNLKGFHLVFDQLFKNSHFRWILLIIVDSRVIWLSYSSYEN